MNQQQQPKPAKVSKSRYLAEEIDRINKKAEFYAADAAGISAEDICAELCGVQIALLQIAFELAKVREGKR
jgi:hypothetical protein